MNSPTDLRELLPEKRSGMPNASRGREKAAMSTLNPRAEINHAVTHLDRMVQQNAELVVQSAAAAGALQSQAGDLAETAGHFRI